MKKIFSKENIKRFFKFLTKKSTVIRVLPIISVVAVAVASVFIYNAVREKQIVSVDVVNVPEEGFYAGEFDEAGIQVKIEYDDDSSEFVQLYEKDLPEDCASLTYVPGEHSFAMPYKGFDISYTVLVKNPVCTITFVNAENETVKSIAYNFIEGAPEIVAPTVEEMAVEGYEFTGAFDKSFDGIKGDTVIKGVYKKLYTVRFYNALNEAVSEQTVAEGSAATAPTAEQMAVDGYRFTGTFNKSFTNVTENLEIQGVYDKLWKVSFYNALGEIVGEQIVVEGEAATVPTAEQMAVDGYRFTGTFDKSFENVSGDLEIHGIYVKLWKVSFYNARGEIVSEQIVDEGSSATAPTAEQMAVEGYRFTGTFDKSFDNVTKDLKVYGMYGNTYVVTFYNQSNEIISRQVVLEGGDAVEPTEAERYLEGYIFKNWDTDFTNVQRDLAVHGVYVKGYTLTYSSADESRGAVSGSVASGVYVEGGMTIVLSAMPEDGCVFLGWYSQDVLVSEDIDYTFVMPTNPLTLVAKFRDGCPRGNHNNDSYPAQAPTCTSIGWEAYTVCKDCGVSTYTSIPALGHDYEITNVVDATCTEDGYIFFECQRNGCDATKTQPIYAEGHFFGSDNICDRCGYTRRNHTHNYVPSVVSPSCLQMGYTVYRCSCGDSYRADYVDQLGHRWSNNGRVVTAKTCTVDGVMAYTCVRCDASYEVIIPASHEWSEVIIVEPTCITDGAKRKTCTACGVIQEEIIPAAHTWGESVTVIKEATCTESGIEIRTCTKCGQSKEFETSPHGHIYIDGVCTICGNKFIDNITPIPEHPEYGMYFEIDDIISNYGPEYINEYGVLLDYNEDANIERVAVFLMQDGTMWRRCIACVGTNIRYATYVPYLAYGNDIKYSGLNSNWINIFRLSENSRGIWCYSDFATIGVNLEDKDGNLLLSLYDIGQAGAKTKIFDNLDEMIAWLLDCDEHTPGDWITVREANCTTPGERQRKCTKCGVVVERESIGGGTAHVDANLDHLCDNGCDAVIGECVDSETDNDHVCDYGCGAVKNDCADNDRNHKCDVCDRRITYHIDENKDHRCDVCNLTVGYHADADKDHNCDTYGEACARGKFGGACNDGNRDGLCDYCGARLAPVGGIGSMSGRVYIANSSTLLSGVSVKLYSGNTMIQQTTTVNGSYSFTNIGYGTYTLKYSLANYIPATGTVTLNSSNLQIDNVGLAREGTNPGKISGYVVDASTNGALSGIKVYIRSGHSNTTGTVLATVTTSSSGYYITGDLMPGNYTLSFVDASSNAIKYSTVNKNVVVTSGTTISNQNAAMTRPMAEDTFKVVLTWGSTPNDLDSHLEFGSTHIYFGNKAPSGAGANLDVDDTSSYGPETVTVTSMRSNTVYTYYIYNWSGGGDYVLQNSGAKVTLYIGDQVYVYNVPSGSGRFWKVFSYNSATGVLTVYNKIQTTEP